MPPWWSIFLAALSRKKVYNSDEEESMRSADAQRRKGCENIGFTLEDGRSENGFRPTSPSVENGFRSALSGEPQKLARVLGLMDLTMLGVGATLGVGVYVLAGAVAKNQAGPSVIVSFAIAALASLLSGFCYSEFASRIPKSGSAYNYTYQTIGEFAAYVIGWNLVLELVIGTASEAKAIANQIDSLMGNAYQIAATRLLPIRSTFLSSYPDLIAPVLVAIITGLLSLGSRESTKVNNIFTFVNLGTVGVIVLSGLCRINPANWSIKKFDIPAGVNGGAGGFAPFGVNGIITGAARCFFGFVGFDGIACTGEETKNPKRNMPLAIILSLLIVFLCYFSIAVVITMVLPYYEQNAEAPFPTIFDRLGWPFMKWAVTLGSLVALFTAMFGAFFPLPRILYSMSMDGLLYRPFCTVHPKTKIPLISTVASGIVTAIMSAIFKLDQLVDMMSIGTLLAYIIVAFSVLLLRYSDNEIDNPQKREEMNVETLGIQYRDTTDIDFQHGHDHSASLNEHKGESIPDVLNGTILRPIEGAKDKPSSKTNKKTRQFHPTESFINPVATDPKITVIETGIEGTYQKAIVFKFKELLNTKNERSVTPTSQRVSKYCTYILIGLTILISFLLNGVTYESDLGPSKPADDFIGSNGPQILLNRTSRTEGTVSEQHLSENHEPLHPTIAHFLHAYFSRSRPMVYLKESADWTPETCSKVRNIIYIVVGLAYFATFSILSRQGQNTARLNFKVPFVPLVPCVSIFMNVYLMINLDISTWVRFLLWMSAGLVIYFSYSIFHSKQKVV